MKKLFSILMMAAAMTAMVACGEKDNTTDNSGGNTEITDLNGTMWRYDHGTLGEDGFLSVALSFVSASYSSISVTTYNNGMADGVPYGGPYTYTNGQGSIELTNMSTQQPVGTATFSISGTTLTLQMLGETYTLTKQQ